MLNNELLQKGQSLRAGYACQSNVEHALNKLNICLFRRNGVLI